MTKRQQAWNGMNWIRKERRLALYLRDGLACAYCGAAVEDGVQLTLDHIRPAGKGGSNGSTNLVTCCSRCNSSRGDRPVATFAKAVAGYLNGSRTADEIVRNVNRLRRRAVPLAQAKQMIAERVSATGR
jgi:hypothetical protein